MRAVFAPLLARAVNQQIKKRDNVSEAGYPAFVWGEVMIAHLVPGVVEPRLARSPICQLLLRCTVISGDKVKMYPLGQYRALDIPFADMNP